MNKEERKFLEKVKKGIAKDLTLESKNTFKEYVNYILGIYQEEIQKVNHNLPYGTIDADHILDNPGEFNKMANTENVQYNYEIIKHSDYKTRSRESLAKQVKAFLDSIQLDILKYEGKCSLRVVDRLTIRKQHFTTDDLYEITNGNLTIYLGFNDIVHELQDQNENKIKIGNDYGYNLWWIYSL